MIAGRLTMRAEVERNAAAGTDSWGQPVPPVYAPVGSIRCFAWTPASREVMDGDKVAAIQDVRIMVGFGTDLRVDDEIARITDRGGKTLFAGRLRVDGPLQYKHTHLEAPLKRVG